MPHYAILGAGVTALTTALELLARHPDATCTLVAAELPSDPAPSASFCSPWAGANWASTAVDDPRGQEWDRATYVKFGELADEVPEAGVRRMGLRVVFEGPVEEAGVLEKETGEVWYKELCGVGWWGKKEVKRIEGARAVMEMESFQMDVSVYLPWLFEEVRSRGVEVRKVQVEDITEVGKMFPNAEAVFNCTGLGSHSLQGVRDKKMTPTRGQVVLVKSPPGGLQMMYERKVVSDVGNSTYIYPRGEHGDVVLGGSRTAGNWDGEADLDLAEDIKRRCCALCSVLGAPESLEVVNHGIGLRPTRHGGPRIEKEIIDGITVIHSYGAGGSGYQSSWGMAKNAVDLLPVSPT